MKTETQNAFAELSNLYALNDAERFPASQTADGLERESTLFYADFTVADKFGLDAVKNTFERADFKRRGYKVLTELVAVLNHKCWEWHDRAQDLAERGQEEAAKEAMKFEDYYLDRYNEVDAWAVENLKGDEAEFFYRVLD